MTTSGVLAPPGSSRPFSVHLLAFHPFFWRETVQRQIASQTPFRLSYRVDSPASYDLGIALLAGEGDSLAAIGLVAWSRSKWTDRWVAELSHAHLLPPAPLDALGQPRALLDALLVHLDDGCDAGTRDVAASSWPALKESLGQHDGRWSRAIALVENHLLLEVTERGDTAHVASLLDHGAALNTDVLQTEQLLMGDDHEVRIETVERRCESALDRAVRCGHHAMIDLLLDRGARADATALGHAIARGDLSVVRRLLDRGADPNGLVWTTAKVSTGGYIDPSETVHLQVPAMELVANPGQRALFLLLAAAGGTPGPSAREMYTWILWNACGARDPEAVRPVLEEAERAGILIEPIEVVERDPAIFRFALERKWRLHPESAAVERRIPELTACLLRAARHAGYVQGDRSRYHQETIHYLISQGADADFFDPRPGGEHAISPLHEALLHAFNPELIRMLLEHGARTTYVFEDGHRETAREIAAARLHPADFSHVAEILRGFEDAQAQGRG